MYNNIAMAGKILLSALSHSLLGTHHALCVVLFVLHRLRLICHSLCSCVFVCLCVVDIIGGYFVLLCLMVLT